MNPLPVNKGDVQINSIAGEGTVKDITVSVKGGRTYTVQYNTSKDLTDNKVKSEFLEKVSELIRLHDAISNVESGHVSILQKPGDLPRVIVNQQDAGTIKELKKDYKTKREEATGTKKQQLDSTINVIKDYVKTNFPKNLNEQMLLTAAAPATSPKPAAPLPQALLAESTKKSGETLSAKEFDQKLDGDWIPPTAW